MKKGDKILLEDYQREVEKYNKRAEREYNSGLKRRVVAYGILSILFLVFIAFEGYPPAKITGIPDKLQLFASKALVPYIVFFLLFIVIFETVHYFLRTRCPECGRYFSYGKPEHYTSFERTGIRYDSSGDTYFGRESTMVFFSECKFCKELIMVVK